VYRLLIVDDERFAADALYDVFTGNRAIDLDVYKAYSAYAALELLGRTRVDIILSDIRMPGMSGLELLEKVKESWPQCRVIFLTGYNEFDYVYTAIQHKNVSYLLKSEGYERIFSAVQDAVRDIDSESHQKELLQIAGRQMDAFADFARRGFLHDFIHARAIPADETAQHFAQLNIRLSSDKPVQLLYGRADDDEARMAFFQKNEFCYSVNLIVKKYLEHAVTSAYTTEDNMDMIWFLQPIADYDGEDRPGTGGVWERNAVFIKGTLEVVQAVCKESLGRKISFLLEERPAGWSKTGDKIDSMRQTMNSRAAGDAEVIFTVQAMESNATHEKARIVFESHARSYIKQIGLLETYLDRGQQGAFKKMMHELTDCLKSEGGSFPPLAAEVLMAVALMLFSYINRNNLLDRMGGAGTVQKLISTAGLPINTSIACLQQISEALLALRSQDEQMQSTVIIGRIKQYIEDHVADDLSLIRLSDVFHFNPSYLSRMFKQSTDSNLSDHITEVRINKARNLLASKNLKIQDVAAAVGYDSSTNFGRSFKKVTNMTPQEFRDMALNK
jgi:two-component system response regulator YesN